MPESLLERPKRWVVVVDELVKEEDGGIWWQDRSIATRDRDICTRCTHNGHACCAHHVCVWSSIGETSGHQSQVRDKEGKAIKASKMRHLVLVLRSMKSTLYTRFEKSSRWQVIGDVSLKVSPAISPHVYRSKST